MKMPQYQPASRCVQDKVTGPQAMDRQDGVVQAGCCLQVCAPIVGCHCVAEAPFC